MRAVDEFDDLADRLHVFPIWILSGVIDAAFVVAWVFVQWFVNEKVIEVYPLAGIDRWALGIIQGLFAVSTLVPIIAYVVVDIVVILNRARTMIMKELGRSKAE
jgi:lipid-A-disaccharide synthase-like uncharacterized protein